MITILIIEATIVGIVLLVITYMFSLLNLDIGMWNSVFVVGFLTHIVFEIIGLNSYYVKYKTETYV